MLSDEQIWQLASQEGDTHDDSFIFNRDGRWSVLSFARAIESALSQSTEQGEREHRRVLPHPGSPEASAMMDSMLAEYQWPANTKNAARAGWEAANRWLLQRAAMSPHGDGGRG